MKLPEKSLILFSSTVMDKTRSPENDKLYKTVNFTNQYGDVIINEDNKILSLNQKLKI